MREATPSQNNMNSSIQSNNTTGHSGVYLNKRTGGWFSRVHLSRKIVSLGSFRTKEEAVEARKKAEKEFYGQYNANR